MAVVYPSKDWLDELKRVVNSDEEYKKVAANWEGDYLVISEVDEEALNDFKNPKILKGFLSMIYALPKERRAKYKGTPSEVFLNKLGLSLDEDVDLDSLNYEELTAKVAEIKIEEVKGAASYIWLDFWHGELRHAEPVAPGEKDDARFKLSGPYAAFKEMIFKKIDPTTMIMQGKLKLQGDLAYMMRNIAAVRKYNELQNSIEIDTDP
ncbi:MULTISPECIES: SCP2 sterol-binding domain-containing protein [unclassified Archaeoglobus]|jgi:putative sterol carrier protein|uniref:SCP2 sterol-binding domain-containing protein n=1 Tax=unclassified Archaeoglobus TaxID=2643606 RepID=UPI0025BF3A31|nr:MULTISPECIES: SCP2 sterol-binding domain-containing protein [unclassified Archaeoglobus]